MGTTIATTTAHARTTQTPVHVTASMIVVRRLYHGFEGGLTLRWINDAFSSIAGSRTKIFLFVNSYVLHCVGIEALAGHERLGFFRGATVNSRARRLAYLMTHLDDGHILIRQELDAYSYKFCKHLADDLVTQ